MAFHNGVLAQDHAEVLGSTRHKAAPAYSPHPAKGPLVLQDHSNPLRYRNLWIRPLGEEPPPPSAVAP